MFKIIRRSMLQFHYFLLTLALLFGSSVRTVSAESVPDMLEKTLPGIVTIGVFKGSKVTSNVYGFSESKSVDIAYTKKLDLSGANSCGSGFIVAKNGKKYIVTNAHVIDSAGDDKNAISAFSINRTKYPVKVLGADTMFDVAVLEFIDAQPGPEFETLQFRTKEIRVGEQVFAIGNPLGDYPYTTTQGIVGGKNRVRSGFMGKFGYIQSSATTIWGNSGGPLVDGEGRVVGINSQIAVTSRDKAVFVQPQINFALEADIASKVVNDIIEKGRVVRSYLGIVFTQSVNLEKPYDDASGVVISGLVPGSPAAAALAGKEGYRVMKINGAEVVNVEEALGEFEKVKAGSTVTLDLQENKEKNSVSFETGELTQSRHAEIGSFFLKSFAKLDSSRKGSGVALSASPTCADGTAQCKPKAVLLKMDLKTEKYEPLETSPKEFNIKSAGLVSSIKDNAFKLWNVNNPANLGLILRITALNGFLTIVGTSGEQPLVMSMALTEDGQNVLKTLMY